MLKPSEVFGILTPSKAFFRALATGLLVVVLVSQFPWMNNLVGRLLNFPDLRHRISLGGARESELRLVGFEVINRGFGKAENVLVHVCALNGNILHYRVDSQESYEIKKADLQAGVLDISLERLASGASARVWLAGTEFMTDTLFVSATSDQGSSISTDSPGFSDYVHSATMLFYEAGRIVWEAPAMQELIYQASGVPIVSELLLVLRSYDFQQVALAALILVVFVALFLPDSFMVFIPFLVAFVAWLFFPALRGRWIVGFVVFVLVLFFMLTIGLASEKPKPDKGESGPRTTSQGAESVRVITAGYEGKIAELERALARREEECRVLERALTRKEDDCTTMANIAEGILRRKE